MITHNPVRVRLILTLGFAMLCLGPGSVLYAQNAPSLYVVKAGDTLFRIAQVHHLTVPQIRQWNALDTDDLAVGQQLQLSAPSAIPEAPTIAEESVTETSPKPPMLRESTPSGTATEAAYYLVHPGETLFSIARRFGITADTLFILNDHVTAPLEARQPLRLPERFATIPYRVRRGENLSRIAAQHGISLGALRGANKLRGDRIRVGQVLNVPTKDAVAPNAPGSLPEVRMRGAMIVYPSTFAGRITASGIVYDPDHFSVSHASLPLGTVVLLTNPATHRSTFAEVNDRGPLDPAYLMDVSAATAHVLGLNDRPRAEILVRVVR